MDAVCSQLERQLNINTRFKDNIGKYVRLKTEDSLEHDGWLLTIDPMSGNMFILTFEDDLESVKSLDLIMGHACPSVEVLKEPDEKMKDLLRIVKFDGKTIPLDDEERKNRLIDCIKKNRLPFEEKSNQVLVVCNVTISPPYDKDSCQSTSRTTLDNMKKIIKKMDKELLLEFEEKRKKLLGSSAFYNEKPTAAPVDLEQRKNDLIAWIKKNRHPVRERDDQSLVVYENVKVYPPYDVKSVRSSNKRVLKSMKKLIVQMDKQTFKEHDEQSE